MNDATTKFTPRDIRTARRVKWAEQEKLNPRAIDYARKYANLDETMLTLISAYENAIDLPAGDIRENVLRHAWDNVIRYVRTFQRNEVA